MYNVGSAGIVDPADIAEVVCAGSVIQVGQSIVGIQSSPAGGVEAAVGSRPPVTATVRYAVTTELAGARVGGLMLVLRYRSGLGGGSVVATLTEVALVLDVFNDPGVVTETALMQFDSAQFDASDSFQTKQTGGPTGPNPNHVLDFQNNVYYVTLSLTAAETLFHPPPAVAAIGLVPWQQFWPRNGTAAA
jgi:hypothetical protein